VLNRVALERRQKFADIVLDFVPDPRATWPELIEVSTTNDSTRVRLRVHVHELEVLAVALDSAFTGGDGELYFRPSVPAGAEASPGAAPGRSSD
jgi:hypothetical protein